jgi:uncharacterized FlaG/YvyC family protein
MGTITIDPISNATTPRELSATQNRAQLLPPAPGVPDPATNLTSGQRVEVLRGAVEKLIKKSLPPNSKLQIEQDKTSGTFIYRSVNPDTGEVITQWPPEKLLELRDYLKEMEGVLVNTQV